MLALAREAPGDQVACENADFRLGVSAEQRHLRSLRCGSDRFRAFGWRRSDHIQNRLDVRPVGRPAFHQASRALFQQLLVAGRRLRRPFVDRREQGQAELQAIAPSLNTSSCSSSLNQDQRPGQATYCAIALTLKHRARQASAPKGLLRLEISFHLSGVEEKAAPTQGSGRGRKPLALVECTWEVDYRLAEGYQPPAEAVKAFKDGNAVFNCWQYFREYVQNTITRINLPPLTVPLLHLAPKPPKKKASSPLPSEPTERPKSRLLQTAGGPKPVQPDDLLLPLFARGIPYLDRG
jgi:hypothetical protein